jgi:hypothetical protein
VALVLEVGGILILGALLGVWVAPRRPTGIVVGVSLIAVALAGIAFWGGLWNMGRTFIKQSEEAPTVQSANANPGSLFPANETFLEAVEHAVPRNASMYLICGPNQVGCDSEWISYRLSPRLFTEREDQAQYVVVYGDSPTTVAATAHLPLVLNRSEGGVVRNPAP